MRASLGWLIVLFVSRAVGADEASCRSVLLFDLEDDGLFLSDVSYPVEFDLDSDGVKERVSWTASGQEEAFLWLDLDQDNHVDGGAELVCGGVGDDESSFDRLRRFDQASAGGNGDGWLNSEDRIWSELRLWVDRDHDAKADRREVGPLSHWEITGINLGAVEDRQVDGSLNLHTAISTFRRNEVGVGPLIEVRLRRVENRGG